MNTKPHAISDANGRPLSFFMPAGQVSDYTGAAVLLDDLPPQPFQRCCASSEPWAAPPKAQ